MKKIKTPCIGICSTVFGDEVCRGCKRFVHEVIDWNAYEDEQKSLVLERLKSFTEQVIAGKIKIIDKQRFSESLKIVGVQARQSWATAILDFLRKSSKQIENLGEHGLEQMPEYRLFSAEELKFMIEEEILVLSQATYSRSFKRKFTILAGPADEPAEQQKESTPGHSASYSVNHASEVIVS
jgi:uncharacterized protein